MRRLGVALLALVSVLLASTSAHALPRLHAEVGARAGIYDDAGRQVLLRGVDVNALGDYYAVSATLAPVVPLTEQDFADIAKLGMNEVRLIVSWSSLEPRRGAFDAAYLARIRQAVGWAAAHDIHVVLDMHQDAWGKFVATPPSEQCLPGFSRGQGWDGAPAWATLTDGLPTCRLGIRELSPAVADAWQSFWDDRAGIQDELVATWAKLARAFADDPTVAGYDLLNEPNPGLTLGVTQVALMASFYSRAIAAIRGAEAGGFHHIVFFEPGVEWSAVGSSVVPPPGFSGDRNVVFSPHLYGGSLAAVGVDTGFKLAAMTAAGYRTTVWSGEWGWFGDPAADAPKVADYARQEDAYRWGGAWWQWKQACGDPHNFGGPSGPPGAVSPSLNRYACPAQTSLGIPASIGRILARAYPRAAPGRLDKLVSDPATGRVEAHGTDPDPAGSCTLDLWAPSPGAGLRPTFAGTNVDGLVVRASAGGWRVTGCAHGAWTLRSGTPVRLAPAARRCAHRVGRRHAQRAAFLRRLCARYRGRPHTLLATSRTNSGRRKSFAGIPRESSANDSVPNSVRTR